MRAALALSIALAACSVDNRSDTFRCQDDDDCSGDRSCERGWCVTVSVIDAAPFVCPPACDRCEGQVCVFECDTSGACDGNIDCPDEAACEVLCSGAQSCAGDITCPASADCTIECSGIESCSGDIVSGTGRTDVECVGPDSCSGGIECSSACSCDVDCVGFNSCDIAADCPRNCEDGSGCRTNGNCSQC